MAAGGNGGQIPAVPQMALRSCLRLAPPIPKVPQIAESTPGSVFRPRRAVHAGITKRTAACSMLELTIEFISDDCSFFMSFAFLIVQIVDNSAGFVHWYAGTPNHAGAPDNV